MIESAEPTDVNVFLSAAMEVNVDVKLTTVGVSVRVGAGRETEKEGEGEMTGEEVAHIHSCLLNSPNPALRRERTLNCALLPHGCVEPQGAAKQVVREDAIKGCGALPRIYGLR
jgi:hypothetical protein